MSKSAKSDILRNAEFLKNGLSLTPTDLAEAVQMLETCRLFASGIYYRAKHARCTPRRRRAVAV
jgi:hypothetical protein